MFAAIRNFPTCARYSGTEIGHMMQIRICTIQSPDVMHAGRLQSPNLL